jgi:uncharacterized protein (DUF488 family)
MHLYTVGHSTRAFTELVDLLRAHAVLQVADVRSFPGSRRHPQFARTQLQKSLEAAGIAYGWMRQLGGMRRLRSASIANAGWREAGFRAYADHMATPEFETARAELEAWARGAATACLCAEADPLRCHRQLLADALVARGWEVSHIHTTTDVRSHDLTSFARVDAEGRVTYPGEPQLRLPL